MATSGGVIVIEIRKGIPSSVARSKTLSNGR
jgi:hypothetical protein